MKHRTKKHTPNTTRTSSIRETMVCIIQKYPSCRVTPTNIQKALAEKGVQCNKTTVYRELGILSRLGLIQEVRIPGGILYYERSSSFHCHFVCTICGSTKEAPCEESEQAVDIIQQARRVKFTPANSIVEMYGMCDTCHNKVYEPK